MEEVKNHCGDERHGRKLYNYQGTQSKQRADKALRRFRRTAALRGRLKRSAGAMQLVGRLAILETHTL